MGKQILEEIFDLVDEDMFWSWFEPEEFYSRSESAFKDEGDDFSCDYCDYEIAGWEGLDEDKAEDAMTEHIYEYHSDEIIKEELRKYFVKPSNTKQVSVEESIGDVSLEI